MNKKFIGNRIKEERTRRNYTLEDIAQELSISKSMLSLYENEGITDLEKIQMIADFFEINISKLISDDTEEINIESKSTSFYNSNKFKIINIKNDLNKSTIENEILSGIKTNKSMYVFINDEEILNNTFTYVNEKYDIKILNFKKSSPHGYNPFNYIKNDEDIFKLVDFISEKTNKENIHSLLTALIIYLIKYRPKEEQNFISVMKLLRAAEIDENIFNTKSPLDRIFDEVAKRNSQCIALKQYMAFNMNNNKSKIICDCIKLFSFIELDDFKTFTNNPNDIELDNFDKLKITYIIIPNNNSVSKLLFKILKFQLSELLIQNASEYKITNNDLINYITKINNDFTESLKNKEIKLPEIKQTAPERNIQKNTPDINSVVKKEREEKWSFIDTDEKSPIEFPKRKTLEELKKACLIETPLRKPALLEEKLNNIKEPNALNKNKRKIDFNKPVIYDIQNDLDYKFPIMDTYNLKLALNGITSNSTIIIYPLYIPEEANVDVADILVCYFENNKSEIYTTKGDIYKEIVIKKEGNIEIKINASWKNSEFITKIKTNCIGEEINLDKTRLEDTSDFHYLQLNVRHTDNENIKDDKLRIFPTVINNEMNFIYTFEGITLRKFLNGISKTPSFIIDEEKYFYFKDESKENALLYCQCLKQDEQLMMFIYVNKLDFGNKHLFINNYLDINNYIPQINNRKISEKYNYDQYKFKDNTGEEIRINIIPIYENIFIDKNIKNEKRKYFSIASLFYKKQKYYVFIENNVNKISFGNFEFCITINNVHNKNTFKTNIFSINALELLEKNTYRTNTSKESYDNIFRKQIATNYISNNEMLNIYTIPIGFEDDKPSNLLTLFYEQSSDKYTYILNENPFNFLYDNNSYINSIANNVNIVEKNTKECKENNINLLLKTKEDNMEFSFFEKEPKILKNTCTLELYDEIQNGKKELTSREARRRENNKTKELIFITIPLEEFVEEKKIDFLLITKHKDKTKYILSNNCKINEYIFNEHKFSITSKYLQNGTFSTSINTLGITKKQECVKERKYDKIIPDGNKLGYPVVLFNSEIENIKLVAIPMSSCEVVFILQDLNTNKNVVNITNGIFEFDFNNEKYTAKLLKRNNEYIILLQKEQDVCISGYEKVSIKDL